MTADTAHDTAHVDVDVTVDGHTYTRPWGVVESPNRVLFQHDYAVIDAAGTFIAGSHTRSLCAAIAAGVNAAPSLLALAAGWDKLAADLERPPDPTARPTAVQVRSAGLAAAYRACAEQARAALALTS